MAIAQLSDFDPDFVVGLNVGIEKINRSFRIVVRHYVCPDSGKVLNTLVGVRGLIRAVGSMELANKLINRALRSTSDKVTCRLRRGIVIVFYSK